MSEETDAIGTKKYVYDKLGRIVETISGEGYITSYRYDGVGNIIEKTDENNKITNYTYDLNNRLIKITNPEGEITEYCFVVFCAIFQYQIIAPHFLDEFDESYFGFKLRLYICSICVFCVFP